MPDDGMVGKARALYEQLRKRHSVEYDDNGAIGRRYRRQDEIGTPFGITIDHETMRDGTVTLRDRDSTTQVRIPEDRLASELWTRITGNRS